MSGRPASKAYEAEASPVHPFSTTRPSLAGIELRSHGTLLSQKFSGEGIGRLVDARIRKLKPLCCHQIRQPQPSVDGFSGRASFQCTIARLMNKYDHIVHAFSGMASALPDETCTFDRSIFPCAWVRSSGVSTSLVIGLGPASALMGRHQFLSLQG